MGLEGNGAERLGWKRPPWPCGRRVTVPSHPGRSEQGWPWCLGKSWGERPSLLLRF